MSKKHIDDDDDDEYEEEELFIYADLESILPSEELNESTAIKIIGVDSETPIMQINNKIFKGTYDYPVGTNIFFVLHKNFEPTDAVFGDNVETQYKYFGDTNKILKMKRIFVQPVEQTIESTIETEEEKTNRITVTKTYEEALNQFLKPGEKPPRKISPIENAPIISHQNEEYLENEQIEDDVKDDDPRDEDYVPTSLDI